VLAATGADDGRNLVCLDPGHGGSDRGKVREREDGTLLQEKDLVLAHALELGRRLQARGIEVVYTRTTDVEANPDNLDVNGDGEIAPPDGEATSDEADDLQARTNVCNEANADLLVSMHYNSSENEFLNGYEVWYNDQRPFSDRSRAFASMIHQRLGPSIAEAGYPIEDHGLGVDDYFVLGPAKAGRTPSEMPGAIIEGLYLSNAADAAFVETEAATEAIVNAYEDAIVAYFADYPG
jgi:N-acetylmuramoyl-L-alanine amidase